MKFNYTKVVNGKDGQLEFKAGFDTDIVWHYVQLESGSLVLHTTLDPIETYQTRPVYNSKGAVNGYADKKITEPPIIEITKEDEIERFLNWWNTNS